MTEEEIMEWDYALVDLVAKGLVEVIEMENGEKGFRLKPT